MTRTNIDAWSEAGNGLRRRALRRRRVISPSSPMSPRSNGLSSLAPSACRRDSPTAPWNGAWHDGRWSRVHHGVYLTTPGRDDWWTGALAAHLFCGPHAAWSHETAAFVWGLIRREPRLVEILVPRHLEIVGPTARATCERRRHLDERVDPLWWPWRHDGRGDGPGPRRRRSVDDVFALLGRAFQRQTDIRGGAPVGVSARATTSPPCPAGEVLGDVASGAESTMEVSYLRDVERAHGLPRGRRQHPGDPVIRSGTTSPTGPSGC